MRREALQKGKPVSDLPPDTTVLNEYVETSAVVFSDSSADDSFAATVMNDFVRQSMSSVRMEFVVSLTPLKWI